jgi:hypothetical protein
MFSHNVHGIEPARQMVEPNKPSGNSFTKTVGGEGIMVLAVHMTLDGYVFRINIVNGLPYITMHPYTDDEWDSLPHVVWTGDSDLDPTILGHHLDDDSHWFDAITDLEARPLTNLF